ncbi:hypothetical protein Hypma_003519 [Hypsizygus marmoreus]|uniref:Protein kinase domain-containing protein n=1 Tax=Hypsizygus marmoreus TaxID=39966 RepID=A0A369J3L9_HYPMA|nr:hypothetical protein Hypma_003519 [Hypsizygus marmoreus]
MSPCKPSERRTSDAADSAEQRLIRDELEKLFNWNPQEYVGAGSASTRAPNFFDQHLDDDLILKEIVHFPSLATDLAKNVDIFLPADRILPPFPPDFKDREDLDALSKSSVRVPVTNEKQVTFNFRTLQGTLPAVASALALGHDWDSPCFSWIVATKGENHAVPDGYLSTCPLPKTETSGEIGPVIEELLKEISSTFPTPGLLEFKTLRAGSKEHLEGIIMLSSPDELFPWCRCPGAHKCRGHYNASGLVTTGAPMGPDLGDKEYGTTSQSDSDEACTSKKRKAKVKWGQLHSIHMTQQVWAELVRHDATYAMIHCGNYEMHVKRERKGGRLYVSDVIEASKYPGYGKLHIGAIIAMYLDTQNRTRLVKSLGDKLPEAWTKYRFGTSIEQMDNTSEESEEPKSEIDREVVQKNLRNLARTSPFAVITIKAGNLFRQGFVGKFRRVSPFDKDSLTGKADTVCIDLHAEIPGSVMVFDAKLHVNKKRLHSPLVVKWARSQTACTALELEFHVFQTLKPLFRSIPNVLGFFTLDDSRLDQRDNQGALLVMGHCGTPLDRRGTSITLTDRLQCIRCLYELHCSGYIHGNLTASNLLAGRCGVRLCGLQNVKESNSPSAKLEEFLKLAEILNDLQQDYMNDLRESDEAIKRPRKDLHPATSAVLLGPMSSDVLFKLKSKNHLVASPEAEQIRANIRQFASKIAVHDSEFLYIETTVTTGPDWGDLLTKNLPNVPYHCFQVSPK